MADAFQIHEVEAAPGRTVLRVHGHLNAANTSTLLERCQAIRMAHRSLVLSLAEVSFIGSSGVGGLLALPEEFHEAGLSMRFAQLSPAVDAVIRLLNLHQYLDITPTEESALEALKR